MQKFDFMMQLPDRHHNKTLWYFITGTLRSLLIHPYNNIGTRSRNMRRKEEHFLFKDIIQLPAIFSFLGKM